MIFRRYNMGLLLLGGVNVMGEQSLDPPPTRSNVFHDRNLGSEEAACRDSRTQYFKENTEYMPLCESCARRSSWTESYGCEDHCSNCVGTDCTLFSFTESWQSEYGLVSHYRKGYEYCVEKTRGKDIGRKICENIVYDRSGDVNYCEVFIDGKECAWCEYQSCAMDNKNELVSGIVSDCTNLFVDSTENDCTGEYNGIFESFYIDEEVTIECDVQIYDDTNGFDDHSAATSRFSRVLWPLIGFFCMTICLLII